MRRVLATDFGIWPAFDHLDRVPDAMFSSPDYWSRLANYILLYDQIVIPTGNFQILPILRLILKEDVFDDLVRNKGIVLARFDQWFAYIGNGGGLNFFQIHDNPDIDQPDPNLAKAFYMPTDEAISTALLMTNPPSTSQRRSQITNLLLDNIINLPTKSIADGFKDETYKDILGSSYLRDFLSLRNTGRSLDNLVGISPNQVNIFNPHLPPNADDSLEIRAVLSVAFENFLLSIAGHLKATDIAGDNSTLSLLRAKGQRLGFATEGRDAFVKLQNISAIPDLGSAFSAKQLSSEQLLDLRYSKHSQALRDWLGQNTSTATSDEIVQRYIESLGQPYWLDSLPTKLLRFATTTGMGALEPITGSLTSAIDTFFLSKWFPGKSPRIFMKQAKVVLENTPVIQKPVMRGRDRNTPCSCGSGKKFKKCCGRRT